MLKHYTLVRQFSCIKCARIVVKFMKRHEICVNHTNCMKLYEFPSLIYNNEKVEFFTGWHNQSLGVSIYREVPLCPL